MRRATYADLEAVPANKVAEFIRGTLYVMPRPATRHAPTSSALGFQLGEALPEGRRNADPGVIDVIEDDLQADARLSDLEYPDDIRPRGSNAVLCVIR